MVRMSPGHHPVEIIHILQTGRRPQGRPRTQWREYLSNLAWECLGIPQEELETVAMEKDVWNSLLPPQHDCKGWLIMDGWMHGFLKVFVSHSKCNLAAKPPIRKQGRNRTLWSIKRRLGAWTRDYFKDDLKHCDICPTGGVVIINKKKKDFSLIVLPGLLLRRLH